ncbi:hypothetical protein CHGG_09964 [Chaetomium globosum CBS 148.51]|uniref:Cytochrome c oxidase assembly protein COX20, mitochondrial n=1 Tax=Chaetomium globosum (strain ATCC 6205 / CBS 148.51 / DSM 1962 / NBRC 6347 / NRRL 1970) TaxID=306901 RepID=Q2GPZ0_CHAGB|nr:uncharacterized protein CHGG_09964 [Chaetomium globosum CBS 148.51]EAQ83560.1 hypothetical protein CHGG_09964 [Chaetomium globosum CBS 148.51]
MTTPQPPTRDQPPADPNRYWVQQSEAAPPTTPSLPGHQQPPQPPRPGDGRPRRPTITEAAQSIKPGDFLTFHQAPCARTGLLTGIGAGAAVGGIRWIMGLPIPRAANWAVGAGALGAIAQYEYCQLKRMQEREKVKRVVEVYAAKQAREKREKYEEEKRERERLEREEEERNKKRWFW